VKKVAPEQRPAAPASGGGWQSQVTEGLVSLGWQPRDADRAVSLVADDVAAESLDTTNVSALLRRALNRLDRA
jgi:Holliday junction resolvasome RuvABC DNA-binding subunit